MPHMPVGKAYLYAQNNKGCTHENSCQLHHVIIWRRDTLQLQYSANIFYRHPYARDHIQLLSFCFTLAEQTYYSRQPVTFLIDLLTMRIPTLMAVERKNGLPNKDDEESVAHFKGRLGNFIQSTNLLRTIMERMGDILVRLCNNGFLPYVAW